MPERIRSLLVANRGEIAIRVMRAATELGIRTVAIYSQEDRFSLHRMKADESYLVGAGRTPVDAYLDIADIVRIAQAAQVDAIHPGYGFLSENPALAEACAAAGLIFVGPTPADHASARQQGQRARARSLRRRSGHAGDAAVAATTMPRPREWRAEVGYPVMLKASWGGGGRGMRVVSSEAELAQTVAIARREAKAAFGNDEVYLEKLVQRARHIEVQLLGDSHGNLVHLFERDCTVQRRNQKVVERAPATFFTEQQRHDLCEQALKIGRAVQYLNAGTVEFLQDADTGKFYFIEVNPRVQVEHTVTEAVTGIDIVRAQIRIAEGAAIGTPESGVPRQEDIRLNGYAMQCRVTTEDPENNFIPDYGRISAYRSPAGFGIRLDAGTAYSGAIITPSYDSLLVKVTAWAQTPQDTIARMHRALWEFRVRGVVTNLRFLDQLIMHPRFAEADYTTKFIDETPELFRFPRKRDRATRLLNFIGEVIVNGNDEVKGRPRPARLTNPKLPKLDLPAPAPGTKQKLDELGAERFAAWMLEQKRVLLTDTTMRDAHQSLLATRFRTHDLAAIAPYYASLVPNLFSVECWGGATFDVAMRFLQECPWQRLHELRAAMPNLLLQMLLRSANAVGYTNYPDNVVRYFVERAARGGIDLFRIFDSLNWVENMRVAIDAVRESGKLCEAAICYTGNLSDPRQTKYDLKYYVKLARDLKRAGAHILGIKDMAGSVPAARRVHAGQGAEGRDRSADPFPHARHQRHRRGQRARGDRRRRGCSRRRGRFDERADVAAEPRLDRRGAAPRPARQRRERGEPAHPVRLLGTGAALLRGVRERPALRRVRGLRARHAGRPVHESARAGALARHRRGALAGSRARLRAGQRDVRRHHQGDADFESGRRPGAADGDERARARAGARSAHADRVPGVGRLAVPRRSRPAVRRLPAGAAEESAQGRAAAEGAARRSAAADRPGAARTPSSMPRPGARLPRTSSRPT